MMHDVEEDADGSDDHLGVVQVGPQHPADREGVLHPAEHILGVHHLDRGEQLIEQTAVASLLL